MGELEQIKTTIQSLIETLINVYEGDIKKAKQEERTKVGGLYVSKGYMI